MDDLNNVWAILNQEISNEITASNEFLSQKLVSSYLDSHNKIIELIKRKSIFWNQIIRAGYKLENDVWKFECAPEYDIKEITSWSSDIRKLVRVQTNNFPISYEDPILMIPKPRLKIDSQIIIGDIVNIRFISGDFGKSKVIDLIPSEMIDSIEYPTSVLARNIETGEDYRRYIVDFVHCPDNNEYYEKKWNEKWERRFDVEDTWDEDD